VNATKFSSIRKSVRIYRGSDRSCSCDEKSNENYRGEYCIRSELFRDFKSYQYYKKLPLTQSLSLSSELKFIAFFCKVLHQRNYCNYLANLCVLTYYDLDRNGPCLPFYKQQKQNSEIAIDEGSSERSEIDGGEKLKPFLFFRSQKSARNLLEKFVDFSYGIGSVSQPELRNYF
jgi:Meckelin (Transmembrane protein 67)